ncbi:MAG: hypothetical protein WBP58_16755 [Chitinophagaceae bacterium]
MELKRLKILLISPQAWGNVRVSKHHYAASLAALGNSVFFLNPPVNEGNAFSMEDTEIENLKVVSYGSFFPLGLRFKFGGLYRMLMRYQVGRLLKRLGKEIDIVWCFEPNLYSDLSWFKARVKIFHPVDVFRSQNALRLASSADIIFSVSPSILRFFEKTGKPMYFINHGLGKNFEELAKQPDSSSRGFENICYVGNMLIPYLDRELIVDLVERFPEKVFHFVGPYTASHSSLGNGDEISLAFIEKLRTFKNVILHGPKGVSELPVMMGKMDAFILCYRGDMEGYDLSNSHKMLEYLSTGKPVISTPIQAYLSVGNEIYMPKVDNYKERTSFFSKILNDVMPFEREELVFARKELSLQNTYMKQIGRIEEKLKLHHLL